MAAGEGRDYYETLCADSLRRRPNFRGRHRSRQTGSGARERDGLWSNVAAVGDSDDRGERTGSRWGEVTVDGARTPRSKTGRAVAGEDERGSVGAQDLKIDDLESNAANIGQGHAFRGALRAHLLVAKRQTVGGE